MTVYRDSADWLRNGVQSGHMVSDNLDELHEIAAKLGLASRYWQPLCLTPHWQLPERLQAEAAALGVIYLERAEFTRMVGRINAELDAQRRRKPDRKPELSARQQQSRKPRDDAPAQQSLL